MFIKLNTRALNTSVVSSGCKEMDEHSPDSNDLEYLLFNKIQKNTVSNDPDDKDDDYAMSRVWKEYKEYLANTPTMPLRGPMNWDISEWTEEEKKEFSFDNMDI